MVAEHLASKLDKEYRKILEIGTGTGIFTEKIAEKFPDSDTTCVDIAHSLLAEAKAKFPDNKFICGDGENLPVGDDDFDLIASSSTFQWFDNPEKSISEMMGKLEKGGQFAFSIFVEGTFVEMGILNKMTGFGSVYDLRPDSAYVEIFKNLGIDAEFETREYVLFFDNVKTFLKKQKGTGATFTGTTKFTSKTAYKKFLELYPELFGEDGQIPVTYKILYISGRK
jgi:malonyl-CoA O-methyltransferase